MHLKILIIGHSWARDIYQRITNNIDKEGITVEFSVYYIPGGKVQDFILNDKIINYIHDINPNLVYFFVGGNDFQIGQDLSKVKEDIVSLFNAYESNFPNITFIMSEVEYRQVTHINRHNTPLVEEFKSKANNFNRWLKNKKLSRSLVKITHSLGPGPNDFKSDGVHLNSSGIDKVIQNLKFNIKKLIEDKIISDYIPPLNC